MLIRILRAANTLSNLSTISSLKNPQQEAEGKHKGAFASFVYAGVLGASVQKIAIAFWLISYRAKGQEQEIDTRPNLSNFVRTVRASGRKELSAVSSIVPCIHFGAVGGTLRLLCSYAKEISSSNSKMALLFLAFPTFLC